ncbi:MAG: amino acid adenylation domain-containing protein, partial [Desulfobacterales bacterium]|nr:amino acid adenylation domain-containing protein [Desulfobacterales bacterium]
ASFDTVILNSVVQYFPDAAYLLNVIKGAVKLVRPGGTIFIGGIRDYSRMDAFHTAVQASRADDSLDLESLGRQITGKITHENELLISPSFFHELMGQFTELSRVETLHKKGRCHNEMTLFRYDTLLHINEDAANVTPTKIRWLDWGTDGLTPDAVRRLMADTGTGATGIRHLPNARTDEAFRMMDLLARAADKADSPNTDATNVTTVGALQEETRAYPVRGMYPQALWDMGDELGCQVLVRCSDVRHPDTFDLIFAPGSAPPVITGSSLGGETTSLTAHVNNPLKGKLNAARISSLKTELRDLLSDYMVPSRFMILDQMPLTPSGKINRNGLPEPDFHREPGGYVPPRTPVEETLTSLWGRVLGLTEVGIRDNFFELGGHSLLATQVISRINSQFDTALSVRELFEYPTVEAFAGLCGDREGAEAVDGLRPVPGDADRERLSFAQERLWFLDQLVSGNPFYNMGLALHIDGDLNRDVLTDAFNEIIRRHETLRTGFYATRGIPAQRIHDARTIVLPLMDLSGIPEAQQGREIRGILRTATEEVFDLSEPPLLRACLIRMGKTRHILSVTMHHIISDGWSMGVFNRELSLIYTALLKGNRIPLPALPVQYADFAAWQRRQLTGEILENQLNYWRRHLDGLLPLNLLTDKPRPSEASYRGDRVVFRISAELTAGIKALGKDAGCSLFMTLLAGFSVLLSRYTGQADIAVGSPIAGRTQTETESLIGFFVNTLVMRTDLSGAPTFRDVLGRVRKTALSAYAHQDLPFEQIVSELAPERDVSRNPLVQVVLALQNAPMDEMSIEGLAVRPAKYGHVTVRMDMEVHLWEFEGELLGSLLYCTDLFERETVQRLADHFVHLLGDAAADPDTRIGDLRLTRRSDTQRLQAQWNDTAADYPLDTCIHHLFEAQAQAAPDAVAVAVDDKQVSYGELNRRADILAGHLLALGVGPDDIVGVCMVRSPEMITGILGVLKAGGAYLPIDPDTPAERQAYMLADAGAGVIVTQKQLAVGIPDGCRVLPIEDAAQPSERCLPSSRQVHPGNLAYVIYTSGSTGRPKGVGLAHRGLVNLSCWHRQQFGITGGDRASMMANAGFDASVWELWPYLIAGARVMPVPSDIVLSPEGLQAFLISHGISISFLPTPLAEQLLKLTWEEDIPLRTLLTGGDRLRHHPDKKLPFTVVNNYGPTENTVVATSGIVRFDTLASRLPDIGTPIDNTKVYILDTGLNSVPVGVPGELYLSGEGLARGYLGRADLTAAQFIPNPFDAPGDRLYRTGDLVRRLSDGRIEFLDRMDYQVKIRGFRIELGEIEAVLSDFREVDVAAVAVGEEDSGAQCLVAYVVPGDDGENDGQWRSDHIDKWQQLYEETYGDGSAEPPTGEPGNSDASFNITGWNSSFTGRAIPEAQMQEGVDNTVDRICSLAPDRVLEIGCGTGLLLSRIAPSCSDYLATDFSKAALDNVGRIIEDQPSLGHVRLLRREADNFEGMETGVFDGVVLNSVVQYFPDVNYLVKVIEGAVGMVRPGGFIFIGDVRDYSRLATFHTAVQMAQASDTAALNVLRRQIGGKIARENELLLAPSFFSRIRQHCPEISRVETLHKQGQYHNELTMFRYDAVLHIGDDARPADVQWLDWERDGLSLADLRRLMAGSPDPTGVRHVPNARTEAAFRTEKLLGQGANDSETMVGTLREQIQMQGVQGIDPQSLWDAGTELGCRVAVLCSESQRPDTFDVIFSSSREPIVTDRVSHTPRAADTWGDYANNPLQGKVNTGRISGLQDRLRNILPAYMIPSRFVILEDMPLTASGKIDRKALPGLDQKVLSQGYTPPGTPVQEILASVWAKVLGLPAVGIHDNFFELGGHSLLATQVISRVNTLLGVEVSVRDLFEGPTIETFAAGLEGRGTGNEEKIPVRPGETTAIPMSFAQERLWFLDQLIQDTPLYNISMAVNLKGELDPDVFARAFREIVRRHEVLRTGFLSREGMPVQQPVADVAPLIVREDFTALSADVRDAEIRRVILAETAHEFDLSIPPLVRAVMIKTSLSQHLLVLTMHHIISDGWSMGVMNRELSALYEAFSSGKPSPLPEPAIQYADFTCWQRRRFSGELYETQLNYWKGQLSNLSVLDLHTDHVRPQVASGNGDQVAVRIPAELTRALKRVSRDADATLFMTLLAGFAVLLSRYTHQDDIALGSPIANRTHAETESLIGCFINTLVLRTDLSGDPTFREAVSRVRKLALDAYAHQDLPFEQLVAALQPERDTSRNPLVQVMFALQNAPMEVLRFGDLEVTPAGVEHVTVAMDMEVHLWEKGDEITGSLLYSVDLFEHRSMAQLVAHYLRLLEDAVENPDKSIADLAFLDKAETHQLLTRWNETQREYPRDKCLHHLFEARALATPDAQALVFDNQVLTYGALNARANQLGHYLKRRGVGPETLVGICAERSMDMIVGMLGILKAGGAYVPIDPEYPPGRKAFILEDTGAGLLLTQERLCPDLPESRAQVICLDRDWDAVAGEGEQNVVSDTGPANPVYGIYTSGTTGKPKGTLVAHRSLVNLITAQAETFGIDNTERILQFSSLSFDASAEQIWLALSTGATLVLVSKETLLDPGRFHDYMLRHRITHLDAVPSFLNAFDFQKSHHIRRILASAEACPEALARRLSRNVDFYNVYGLTETGVTSVVYKVDPDELRPGRLPIGRPIANTRVYILDRRLKPVPVGVPGELYIGGTGLAREYLNRPDLTESGFIPNPFDSAAGSRLYKTGDLCRYLPGGDIQFLGRVDHQVQIRGFRVEPGEIESQLRACDGVDDAVVLPREDKSGSIQLAAYLVPAAGVNTPSPKDMQAYLKTKLPGYMVPSAFALLDVLPLNASGKIDRNALPEADTVGGQGDYTAPRDDTGKTLARIWERVLNLGQVGIHDNFFDIGGNSLLLMKVVEEIKDTLGREIPVLRLFEHPTIDSLCRFLEGRSNDSDTPTGLGSARRGRAGDTGGAKDIAIVGMAGRFPGAQDVNRFWENLTAGVESISFFTDRELLDAGVDPEMLEHPDYVRAGGVIPDIDMFDAAFFDFSPKEASVTDPQNRLFLECAWEALETAGYNPRNCGMRVGVYAGKSMDSYFLENLYGNPDILKTAGGYQLSISNGAEFLATQASYKLDLTGPSIGVQTACSTSLVAVHMAVQSILAGECDMALAGGASVAPAQTRGYLYQKDMIASPDGHCRAFDADARGTVRGNGVGVVVLKRLADAVADGDTIYAVIKGSAVNNDGRGKIGFTAPSIEGQASVIADAQAAAGIAPETLRFIEAHGTGTNLGDPVEIAALTRAFRNTSDKTGFCAVGSLKTNIGHLDAAAGVAGLIKTVLSLHHRKLPPSLHYKTPNPDIDFAGSPFYVNDKLDTLNDETPLRAGVSSFGIGGTNAHMVLEEAPQAGNSPAPRDVSLLMLSAKTENALDTMIENLAVYLEQHPDINLPDVAYTLCVGREAFDHRAFAVCRDTAEAVENLRSSNALFRGHAGAEAEPSDVGPPSGLEALGKRWLMGEPIRWQTLFGDQPLKRIPLPTYPFERRRHWVDRPGKVAELSAESLNQAIEGAGKKVERTGKKSDIADWFYQPVWVPKDKAAESRTENTTCLVFTDPWGLGDSLEKIVSASRPVVMVHAGEAFSRQSETVYTIDPREPEHYETLMIALQDSDLVPGQIVHLWSITPEGVENGQVSEDGTLNLDRTFYSLLHIARGLGTLKGANRMDMAVVSNAMQAVTDEDVVRPEKSALLGPVRTIGLEYPHINCRSIDLMPAVSWDGPDADAVAVGVAKELAGESGGQVIALRDGERYVQEFTPVRIEGADDNPPVLRDRGVYLITGG